MVPCSHRLMSSRFSQATGLSVLKLEKPQVLILLPEHTLNEGVSPWDLIKNSSNWKDKMPVVIC